MKLLIVVRFYFMLTKVRLFRSTIVTSIALAIGSVAIPLVSVRANPSIPTSDNAILAGQVLTNNTAKPHSNSPKSLVAAEPKVETVSGIAETQLVEYLAANKIEFYGAYWCSHCQKQKSLFGATAAAKLLYVECAADGENSQRQLCKDKNIQMFPTWVIRGKYFTGTRDLKEIATLAGYKGKMNFKYRK
jgi:glutaredoxin